MYVSMPFIVKALWGLSAYRVWGMGTAGSCVGGRSFSVGRPSSVGRSSSVGRFVGMHCDGEVSVWDMIMKDAGVDLEIRKRQWWAKL